MSKSTVAGRSGRHCCRHRLFPVFAVVGCGIQATADCEIATSVSARRRLRHQRRRRRRVSDVDVTTWRPVDDD